MIHWLARRGARPIILRHMGRLNRHFSSQGVTNNVKTWKVDKTTNSCNMWKTSGRRQTNDSVFRTFSNFAVDMDGNNIDYSGEHKTKGQRSHCASDETRAEAAAEPKGSKRNNNHDETYTTATESTSTEKERIHMVELVQDVDLVKTVMAELELLEHLLQRDMEESDGKVTNRSIELRGSIKHLMTGHEFLECLNRLELEGAPIWGLSSDEHELISTAREKVNTC